MKKTKSLKDLILDNLLIPYTQFEKEVGLSRETIRNILNDKGSPSILTVKKICKFFNVDYKEYI